MIYRKLLNVLGLLVTTSVSSFFLGSINLVKAQESTERVELRTTSTSFRSRERGGILSIPSDRSNRSEIESPIDGTLIRPTVPIKRSPDQYSRLSIEAQAFWCESTRTKNRTRARYPSGNLVAIEWVSALDGLSPLQRCEKGSESLQLNLIENKLGHLVIGRDGKGRKAICASEELTSDVGACDDSKVIISLSDDDDVNRVLYRFEQVVGSAKPKPIQVFNVISPDEVGKR